MEQASVLKSSFSPDAAKRLISALSHADIREFLDHDAIVRSPRFQAALTYAVDHVATHGDTTVAMGLLAVFETTGRYRQLLEWFCDTADLCFEARDGRIVLKRAAHQSSHPYRRDIAAYLGNPALRGTYKDLINARKARPPASRKRPEPRDVFDAGLVVPGSFEGGRRR